MKPGWILVFFIVSASTGVGVYKLFEKSLSEEKIVFLRDEKMNTSLPAANLHPNGVLCIDIPLLAKQDQAKPSTTNTHEIKK